MKQTKSSGWGLLSLLAVLALAPANAFARDAEPVARTKPVIDQPVAKKHAARSEHGDHEHGAHHRHTAHKQHRE